MMTYNLPHTSTPFVGRTQELADIARLLADPTCRLLTLVGPGGIGKTRLALEVAYRLVDSSLHFSRGEREEVYFVPLQPLVSSDNILSAIADAIDFQFYPGSDPKQQLLDYFRDKALLLVLDNLEHLLDGIQLLSEILAVAPDLRILATSRERLNLVEEWVLGMEGLSFPLNKADTPQDYEAVHLFVQSASRISVGFTLTAENTPAILQICRLVSGMPLGIELASAWVRALSCEEIANEIEHGIDILKTSARNVPLRHRNMRAVLDHSWKLLSDDEQNAFKKLSVFRGGCNRKAAEVVANASLQILSSLVDKSMLRVVPKGRYEIHEILRQYAEERLAESPAEYQATCNIHCAYYAEWVCQLYEGMKGPKMIEAVHAVETDRDNIESGWSWAGAQVKRDDLWRYLWGLDFYYLRNRFQDAASILTQVVASLDTAAPGWEQDELLGCVLAGHAMYLACVGLWEQADASYEKGLAILGHLDQPAMPKHTAVALALLARTIRRLNPSEAITLCLRSESLCQTYGHAFERMFPLINRVQIDLYVLGDVVAAKRACEEGLGLARQFGSPWWLGHFLGCLGEIATLEKDYTAAKSLFEEGCFLQKEAGDLLNAMYMVVWLGEVARNQENNDEARQHYREALFLCQQIHFSLAAMVPIARIAVLLATERKIERAVELASLVLHQRDPGLPNPKDQLRPLLKDLETQLTPALFTAAVERGQKFDFTKIVPDLLKELEGTQAAPHVQRPTPGLQTNQHPVKSFSARELEVLRLVAEGLSNGEIAYKLFLAANTVKWYIKGIFVKLDVTNRTQAVARAHELDLL